MICFVQNNPNFDHLSNNVFRLNEDTSVFNEQVERWLIFYGLSKPQKSILSLNGKEWFRGKDVCRILGFKNINDALLKRVRQSYKTDLKSLMKMTCVDHDNPTPYHVSHKKAYSIFQLSEFLHY